MNVSHFFLLKYGLALLCTALLLQQPNRLVAMESGHSHLLLQSTQSLTVGQVVDAAVARVPEHLLAATYAQTADDQRYLSERWISGVPRLNVSYRDDQLMDDTGVRETDIGVEFDLWRQKERSNAKALAKEQQQLATEWTTYLRWQVSGQVRDLLAQIATEDARVSHAEQKITDAQALLDISRKRYRAGDLPKGAVLQSEALLLEARQQLQMAQAEQVDVQRRYTMLTGLEQRPASFVEAPAQIDQIRTDHPQLQYLLSVRQTRLTQQQLAARSAVDNTTLSVGMKRERGAVGESFVDSLGVAISIPIGGGSYRRASSSEAVMAATEAEVALQRAHHQLQQQFHEVEHQLEIQRETLAIAEQSAELTRRQWQMAKKSFELGESDLPPVILAQQQYQQSQLFLQLQQLHEQALHASYKQVVGELP